MTADRVPAVVVRAGGGETISAAGVRHQFALTGDTTDGRLAVETFELPPSTVGARPHVHGSHDETFLVLAGELTVATDDGESLLGVGDLAHAPRGSLHGFRNASSAAPVRGLCLFTPAGYEQYFRDVHAAAESGVEITDDVLRALRAHYDTVTLTE